MKIHNPNDLEFDPETLRSLARGDLDPVRQAVDDHHKQNKHPQSLDQRERPARNIEAKLPAAQSKRSGTLAVAVPEKSEKEVSGNEKSLQGTKHRSSALSNKSPEELQNEYQVLYQKNRQLVGTIRECEALEIVNFELLALKHYPSGQVIVAAKRRRDLWLMCCLLCVGLVFIGWLGFINAWITGLSFGILVLLLSVTLKPFRALFYHVPSLRALKSVQKAMEFKALNHIKMLEGDRGLAWQCQRMRSYRPSLGDKRFERLVLLSQQRNLLKAMRTVAGIRMYLSYLLEAQQAFSLVKQDYMKTSTQLKRDYASFSTEKLQ